MGLTEPSFLERMELMGLTESRAVTNGDRIRRMTDNELAEWFYKIQCDISDYYCNCHSCEPILPTGEKSWLDWLKQYGDGTR